jgi:hypothetical protein
MATYIRISEAWTTRPADGNTAVLVVFYAVCIAVLVSWTT